MINVIDMFGLENKVVAGQFGVEVEVEGRGLPIQVPLLWNTTHDGSLKGEAIEYVFAKPLNYHSTVANLQELYKLLDGRVNDSVRAGVHVHFNVQKYSFIELMTFITTYLCVEGVMTKFAGDGREGNLFCLRSMDAEAYTYSCIQFARTQDPRFISGDDVRYSALNLTSLRKYGSIEFRALRTPLTVEPIISWIDKIVSLAEYAKQFPDPKEVLYNLSAGDYTPFVCRALGLSNQERDLIRKQDIVEGMEQAQQIAFSLPDWYNPKAKKKF